MLEGYDLSRSLNLISLICIIGSFEGIYLGIFLCIKKSAKFRSNFWLGILVLSVTTFILSGAVYRVGLLPDFPHVVHLHMVTMMLMGPTAYLYVRSCTQKDFEMRPILWLHFLPALVAVAYHLPFYLQPAEDKILAFFKYFLEGELGVPRIITLLKILHPAIYFIICIRLVLEYRKHLSNTASYIDTTFHRWLLFFCTILLLPMFAVIVFAITSFEVFSGTTYFAGIFIFILAVHTAAMVKPDLFQTFPHQMLLPESSEVQKQKYERSNLQEAQKEQYITKLKAFVELEKPYQAPDFTIAQLSEKVNIPSHYLSQVINEKLGNSFLDFINGYRVKTAQEMLINPKFGHYTIMAIAYDAGFNAKSTFYAVFKKHTGLTPSAYRKAKKIA